MLYILTFNVCFNQVKTLTFYNVQITNLTFVGKEMEKYNK